MSYIFFNLQGRLQVTFSLLRINLNKKTAFWLYYKQGSWKKWKRILPKLALFMLRSCWNFCNSRYFFIISSWKLVDQDFYSHVQWVWIGTLNTSVYLISKILIPNNTERLEILIVFLICSFLMSHDFSHMSLGDIETNVIVQSVPRDVLWLIFG